MNQKSNLTLRKVFERFSYGCGDFGCNIIYTAMSAFLLFYYTDYAGVSAMAVGSIMMISRIFDGVSDIIMGVIVDRTKSKFGKARPWILRMCIPEELDKAFNWAERYGLKILIDLHTVPESQNGFDNGGICGVCKWAQNPDEVEFVHTVLERLAKRYGHREGLWGIEVINEPIMEGMWELFDVPNRYPAVDKEMAKGSGPISQAFLKTFYERSKVCKCCFGYAPISDGR